MIVAPRRSFVIPLRRGDALKLGDRTLVMGVLNVTPDSFSDGSLPLDSDRAIARALAMQADGADLIDIGGESTRPGAEAVGAEEEWRRVGPVLEGLSHKLAVPISIDTYRAETARRALDLGACIVNDISGLRYDPALGDVISERGASLILMHTRGRSRDMYGEARYDDVVADVARELQRRIEFAIGRGVPWNHLVVDPGFGFAKKAVHSMTALAHLDAFAALGRPVVSGPSRKSFLTSAAGSMPAADRDWATAAAVTASILAGAHIVRVHRVAEMVQVARVADAVRAAAITQ
jgi:dihydropteroate synthase